MDTFAARVGLAMCRRVGVDRPEDAIPAAIKAIGRTDQSFRNLLGGITQPTKVRAVTTQAIATWAGVRHEWLLNGKGPMVEGGTASQSVGIDVAKLSLAHQWMMIGLGTAGLAELPLERDLRALAVAYNFGLARDWDVRGAEWKVLSEELVKTRGGDRETGGRD